ncbi:hypothetical protein [Streptomyces cinnamoneus]|uniref:hypothetical protein n=1 Tax=Streptomyces cinnamoneus TaxID=53446 RepID=UPI000CEE8513|nr:hypothetical protein [Streptomyces cinnamoneus]PPT14775.1 hypothetical protein CYQ11_19560 [Streptomyces cinnamoneus]
MPDQGPEPTPEPGDDDNPDDDKHDVYKDAPQRGYVPTYFDGHGGIAGVPLTEEQRKAIIAEAERRGMSEPDAKALAYGEPEHAPQAPPPGTSLLVAVKPLYREVAPGETTTTTAADSGPTAPAPPAVPQSKTTAPAPLTATPPGGKNEPKKDEPTKSQVAPTPRSAPEEAKQMLKDIVPDPVEDLLHHMTHLRSFMRGVSVPGYAPTVEVTAPDDSTGAVTMTTRVADDMAVSVTVTTSVDEADEPQPCTISVTVTDPETGEVTVATEEKTVDTPQEVSHAAISEVVDAVVAASQVPDEAPGQSGATSEVVVPRGEAVSESTAMPGE